MVNLFPREVPRVLNLFPRELIEGTPQDFPQANPLLHLRPDPRPKTLGACGPSGFWPRVWPLMQLRVCIRKILWGPFNQLPREQIENSRDFPREQIHHTTPSSFQQIIPVNNSEQTNRMEKFSANVCPRAWCGKTTKKRKVCVTQLNPKQHCRDFVRMEQSVEKTRV